MRCVLRRLRQKECCGGGTLRQRNDGKATEGMETMAVQETDGKQTAMRIDMNSDMGESFGRWTLGDDEALLDVVSSANVACGFHAGRPVRHAENVVIRSVAGGNGRGACGVPRPGRIRAPLCGRVPRRAQGGRDVPDRRVGRHGAVGRRAGAVRETSWRAVQPDRPRRIAGRRRGRGYP